MSLNPEIAEALSDVAKELPRAIVKAAATTAVETVAAVAILAATGYAYQRYTEHKAKKSALKNAE